MRKIQSIVARHAKKNVEEYRTNPIKFANKLKIIINESINRKMIHINGRKNCLEEISNRETVEADDTTGRGKRLGDG